MPSVTDIQQQQQATNIHGKSTPPPPPSSSSTQQTTSFDPNNSDPIIQAILVLEKKQRNLGKRKEKLESYEQEAKTGKELNKDQKDALAKYPEVLGQIDCCKELSEQFKKIQAESVKNQKRILKQAAEEKRVLVSQRLREYAQIRYLLDHRPTTLKSEESTLLDTLSTIINPSDASLNSISRSVDTVLSIYQGGPSSSTIKTLTGKNPQEVREILEELIKNFDTQQISSSSNSTSVVPPSEQEQIKELDETNDIQTSSKDLTDYPVQFDTRNQNISVEKIMQDSPFFSNDSNNQIQDNNRDQSPEPKQYLSTMTVINSNINEQSSSSIENQQQENLVNISSPNDEQQSDEQWQHRRGNGSAHRGGQYNNESGNRGYNRGGPHNYNQQQRRGRGNWYGNSYGGNQRQYNENTRGRGGPNPNYRGNRGGGGYRGNNRGYNNNGNAYQKPAQYHQQVRSAPPSEQ